jgi:hypothetical protein
MNEKYVETALDQFRQAVHHYSNCDWGNKERAREYYNKNQELRIFAEKEIKAIREQQKELQWYRSRYPGPKNPEFQAL